MLKFVKPILTSLVFFSATALSAQTDSTILRHWWLGASVGTTGVGIDVSSHVTSMVRVRAGFDFTPHINVPMWFGLESYTDGGITSGNFGRMQEIMHRLTGLEVDDRVELEAKPTMMNAKLLVDVYPLHDKRWRITAGCYFGGRKVGKAINTMREMPSLLAVNIYNSAYDYIMNNDLTSEPFYKDFMLDPYLVEELREDMGKRGELGIHIGDYKDGKPYMMHPDSEGMVKANAFVNAVKPYLGLGFTGALDKKGRWALDVDAGVMFWGGSPKVITHDGTDLTNDVVNVKGKPGDYLDAMKAFHVYPVVSVRFSYKMF